MGWVTDTELPILPYMGKRFKLILDGGKDNSLPLLIEKEFSVGEKCTYVEKLI